MRRDAAPRLDNGSAPVLAWGCGAFGQLGLGNKADQLFPVALQRCFRRNGEEVTPDGGEHIMFLLMCWNR